MGKSRSPSLTKDPILPEPSSRFLKYLGLDAHPKPRVKKLSGISSNSGRILGPWSRSVISIPSDNGLVSVEPLWPSSVEKYDQQPRHNQHRPSKPTLSLRPAQGLRDLSVSEGPISVPLSGFAPHALSASSPTSPTTSHAPSRARKFSLPFIPSWSSPSSSSKTSVGTPPLSPTASYKTSPSTFPPTPNTKRPSLPPRAPVGELIEPLQYAAPPQPLQPASHMPPSLHPQPLIHPRFDFEARRSARSRSPGNQITLVHPFAISRNEPAFHPPVTSTRVSTFLELTQYLSEGSASSVENDDESIVEFADVLAGGRKPKTSLGLASSFASENALSRRTRRNQALLDNSSACTFPSLVSARPRQSNDKIIQATKPSTAPFPHNVPSEARRLMKSIPSKSPNPVNSSSHVGVGHPVKHSTQAFPWPASDSLEAARAAIDFIATLPVDSLAATDSVQFSPPMPFRSTKPSKRRSRRIFHLPSRAGTPSAAGSRGGTASGLSGNTDSSFLNAAGSILQWPIPPPSPPGSSNHEATLKSRNIPSLAASDTERNNHARQDITQTSSSQRQNHTSPSLRYSLFVLDLNETGANSEAK